MLGDECVKQLIAASQAGGEAGREAKEVILENNLNLVRSVVNRFLNRGYEWDDLFQIGCLGLIKAIDRFDLRQNVRFSTYAVPMIIGEIRRHIRDDGSIKVSRTTKELAAKIRRAHERMNLALGREPTLAELAQEIAVPSQEIVAALEAVQQPVSLQDEVFGDGAGSLRILDQVGQESGENEHLDRLSLEEILARLPERERLVINLRFFQERTQTEVARAIGVSQVQVSRIERNALRMMRQYFQTS